MSSAEIPCGRITTGRFQPGQSGNPKGRPKSESVILRERLALDAEAVAGVVIKKALDGDMQAARLVLERVSPPLKSNAAAVQVAIPLPFTPLSAAGAFLQAAATGTLPPDIAAQLVSATAQLCRIEEIDDLRGRLEALEHATKGRSLRKL